MSIFEMLAERSQEQPFCGITIGIVTDIKDPDKKNRVKVRLLNRTDSLQETGYIRVMTPMAGKAYGAFFLPEVGDEVLVGFVDGDYTDPYVLGSLWNTKAPAPAAAPASRHTTASRAAPRTPSPRRTGGAFSGAGRSSSGASPPASGGPSTRSSWLRVTPNSRERAMSLSTHTGSPTQAGTLLPLSISMCSVNARALRLPQGLSCQGSQVR